MDIIERIGGWARLVPVGHHLLTMANLGSFGFRAETMLLFSLMLLPLGWLLPPTAPGGLAGPGRFPGHEASSHALPA